MLTLDHVNVRTANLSAMVDFYEGAVGLTSGPRPNFPFPGAWLYAGEQAVLHLIEVAEPPSAPTEMDALRLEHVAFRGTDKAAFVAQLASKDVAFDETPLPSGEAVQIHFYDPDGNHIHVDFGL